MLSIKRRRPVYFTLYGTFLGRVLEWGLVKDDYGCIQPGHYLGLTIYQKEIFIITLGGYFRCYFLVKMYMVLVWV